MPNADFWMECMVGYDVIYIKFLKGLNTFTKKFNNKHNFLGGMLSRSKTKSTSCARKYTVRHYFLGRLDLTYSRRCGDTSHRSIVMITWRDRHDQVTTEN